MSESVAPDRYQARIKSFTRRSRELPENLQRTMDQHAGTYVLDVPRGDGFTSVADDYRLDLPAAFTRNAPLVIEIGSGTGDQVASYAQAHPELDFLSFEVWQPGIAKMVSRAAAAGVRNLRIIEADAAQAMRTLLPDACAAEVWTFFPDPWRKARHRKRRLVSAGFAAQVARVLQDGGVWRLATDWDDYAWQMRDVVAESPEFRNEFAGPPSLHLPSPDLSPAPNLPPTPPDLPADTGSGAGDPNPERGGFSPRWDGRIQTRFELRGLAAGRQVHDVTAIRLPRADPAARAV